MICDVISSSEYTPSSAVFYQVMKYCPFSVMSYKLSFIRHAILYCFKQIYIWI